MIPRTLVPVRLSPSSGDAPVSAGLRRSSPLDSRIVVPNDLPVAPIDPRTSIPAHVPLEVLSSRVLIPRDMPVKTLEDARPIPEHVPLTVLDSRTVVPREAKLTDAPGAALRTSYAVELMPEVLEPDVFTTGDVNLLAWEPEEKRTDRHWLARSFSLLAHVAVILLALFFTKLFPARPPSQAQLDLARHELSYVFLPPSVKEVPKIPPRPEPPSPHIRIDPRVLREVAPPNLEPLAGPRTSEMPLNSQNGRSSLPTSPVSQSPLQPQPTQSSRNTQRLQSLEGIAPPQPNRPLNLQLPHMSPGRALQQSLQDAMQGGGTSGGFEDPIPGSPPPSGGGGQGLLGGGVQILTPTEGVDFSNYLARLLASVRRNWYAIIPESARLGEKGRVILEFRILRDGNVPEPEPLLMRTSGKEPLDRAAIAAIRASDPFDPLPPAFTGPYIVLRFTFLYNLPLDYNQ